MIAFLRRWPEVVRTSTWSDRESSSRSIRWMMSRTASAPIPAWKIRPPRAPLPYLASRSRKFQPSSDVSGRVIIGWSRSISSRALADLVLEPVGVAAELLALGLELGVDPQLGVGDLLARSRASSSASRRLSSSLTRSVSAAAILRSWAVAALPRLVAGGEDDLAGRGERDRLLGGGRCPSASSWASTRLGGLGDRVGRLGPLALEVGLRRGQGRVQLVLLAVEDGAQLVLALGEGLAALAAAALGLLVELAEGAGARLLVDVADDVQGEVEDPLEVARADVEQDAEPATACP